MPSRAGEGGYARELTEAERTQQQLEDAIKGFDGERDKLGEVTRPVLADQQCGRSRDTSGESP